jgi:hypothetical protein
VISGYRNPDPGNIATLPDLTNPRTYDHFHKSQARLTCLSLHLRICCYINGPTNDPASLLCSSVMAVPGPHPGVSPGHLSRRQRGRISPEA